MFTFPEPVVLQRALEPLGPLSLDTELSRRAHYHAVAALARAQHRGAAAPWRAYYRAFAAAIGAPAAGHDVLPTVFEEMDGRLWTDVATENVEVAKRLAAKGIRIAVLSNADGTVERALRDLEVCQVGDGPLLTAEFVLDSGTVGVAKPDPEIFRLAVEELGIEAEAVVYVGDNVWTDVYGARRAGMNAVLLDPLGLHPEVPWRIPALRALEGASAGWQ